MNIETRKLNLINWISSIQEDNILEKVEKIQMEKTDWWDTIDDKDQNAIQKGIEQLDNDEYLTHSQVRSKIKERFKF